MNHPTLQRRRFLSYLAAGSASGVLFAATGQAQFGPANRVAERTRRNIEKRHRILSFTRATAQQQAIAAANAKKAQEKLRREWAAKNRSKAKTTPAASVPMSTVVRDLNEPKIQAVKTATSPGAKTSVMAVDVTTGRPVSSQVVNSASTIGRTTDISAQVRAAAKDPEVPGSPPSVFLTADVSMAAY